MKQKGFAPIFVLVGILVISLAAGGVFYFSRSVFTQKSPPTPKPSVNPVIAFQTPKPTPVATLIASMSANETADWKTFTNTQWKYTLKYPSDYSVVGENMGSAEENLDVLIASTANTHSGASYLSYPFFRVEVTFGVKTDLDTYANSSFNFNKIKNKLNAKLEKYINGNLIGWQYDFSGKSFYTTSDAGVTDGKSGFVINYNEKIKVIFLQNKNNIYVIQSADINPFNQILSTFKFVDDNSNNAGKYLACGCGCCGGTTPKEQCLYKSKGESLEKIQQEDEKLRSSSSCGLMGCSLGVSYKYCD